MSLRHFTLCLAALVAAGSSALAKPALFIIGDSTVRNSTAGQQGWGDPLVALFDPAKIEVSNRAIGGRSSRTFLTDGRWAAILAQLKPGDFVLMQFGHNDGGPLNDDRARASLKGNGEATEDIIRKSDGKPETVHSFGWYLRNYARDAKAKGATPIVASLIPRNLWNGDKIIRASADYGRWASQAAAQEQALFIDFNGLLADRFEALGPAQTAALFSGADHTHTSAAGAAFNAGVMAAAIRSLPGCELGQALLPEKLWLPSVFSDHMVMQRDLPLPVWGSATPAATVNVKFAGQSATATADAQGHWRTAISALPAGGPFTLQVSGAGTTLTVADVLVGEVWLCSGQSNMDFTLASTAKRSGNTRHLYPALQQALIEDWRALWKNPELPFYFVQLAAYKAPPTDPNSGSQLAEMRAAQATSLVIPHTGMAVTIDIGDEKSVHPRNKLDVGRRLALLALTGTYGQPGVATGPAFRDAVVEGARIRVRFDPGAGLVAKGGPLRQFAIAGADRKFVWAEATIDGDSVLVSSPAIPQPAFVRYAWADNPVGANLCNTAGLPAAPFRTDR
jgi:rhamnogalacturonan acetylesterase